MAVRVQARQRAQAEVQRGAARRMGVDTQVQRLPVAQRMLQKVGITWPGSPDLPPETPRPPAPNPFLPLP